MTTASWVTSHQTMEQFCWKGVTGRVRYCRGMDGREV
jgi:hypothetical protein